MSKNIKHNQMHLLCLGSKDNIKYNRAELAGVDPDTIPTLIPADILKKWQAGDDAPKYKIQAIEYPIKANGYIYDESFFETYIDALNSRPMPGSRSGHEMGHGKRGPTDLILIGGKVEKHGDGKGIAYLKNYIPPIGESGDNSIFITELDSDMIHFSIVAYTEDTLVTLQDGSAEWHVSKYKYGGRNDAVEYGTGAMKQKTNKVKPAVGGENIIQEGKIMTEKEFMDALDEHKNNSLILPKIMETLKIEAVTTEHKNALKVVSDFAAIGVNDPVNSYKALQAKTEADAKAVFNARLDKEFGVSTKDEPNLIREHAGEVIKQCSKEEEIVKAIAAFKDSPIVKKLAGDKADVFNKENIVGLSDEKKESITIPGNGYEVVKG